MIYLAHMLKKLFSLSTVICTVSLAFPLVASAATTSQTLNQAFTKFLNESNFNLAGDANIRFSEKPISKSSMSSSGDIHVTFSDRTYTASDTTEGRLVFDKIQVYEFGEITEPTVNAQDPLAFQWKKAGGVVYLRLEKIPSSFVTALQSEQLDLTPYIGKWISLDVKELLGNMPEVVQTDNASLLKTFAKEISGFPNTPFFSLIKVEKKTTDPAGHVIMRVRVRINPSFIYRLQQKAIKEIKLGTPDRKATITKINSDFAAIRKLLNRTTFVLTVDQTAGELTRIEIGGTSVEPQKSCSYNKYDKYVCKTNSYRTINFTTGFSIFKVTPELITAPTESMALKDLIEQLTPKYEPLEGVATSTATSTESP